MSQEDTHQASHDATHNEDYELITRCKNGDIQAFESLVKKYQERIYSIVYNMTANHEDAADLARKLLLRHIKHCILLKVTPAFQPGSSE